ncbi:pyridoxamine 5'-phosphate oxidase family protein [Schumannella luteola]
MQLTPDGQQFLTDYHLATLSTLASDGTIHAVPVGFTLVDGVARVITRRGSVKVRNIRERGHATISQVDGGRWFTLVGRGTVLEDAESVAEAVALYAGRYRQPQPNPERVAIRIEVDRMLGSAGLLER